jgi:hypothetical protein
MYWNARLVGSAFEGVTHTLFPMRKGCKVVPYQNSHTNETINPKIMLDNGQRYTPGKAWETVYHAMNEAKHFIYVAGWSVNATVALLLLRRVLQQLPERLGQSLEEYPVRRRLLLLTDRTSLPAETMHTRSRNPRHLADRVVDHGQALGFRLSSPNPLGRVYDSCTNLTSAAQQLVLNTYVHRMHQPPRLPPTERDDEGRSPARLLGRNWGEGKPRNGPSRPRSCWAPENLLNSLQGAKHPPSPPSPQDLGISVLVPKST